MDESAKGIVAARVVLGCDDLDVNLDFFTKRLDFRLDAIHPADSPTTAMLSGHGVAIELRSGFPSSPATLKLLCSEPARLESNGHELVAPNGTRIELMAAETPVVVPEMQSAFHLAQLSAADWGVGRAGMRYRDLIPDRQGGRFIASHIQVPDGGPIPDYVHYHKIRFQMIYCYKGWCRVVYEDQGPPFIMRAGDCVLQPPQIRHRVLESSPGFEVVEIGCPAVHETFADHDLELPTDALVPERDFSGQRYVFHQRAQASWGEFRLEEYECRDTGIAVATNDLASVRVARPKARGEYPVTWSHDAEFVFLFVLAGEAQFTGEGRSVKLLPGDAMALPSGESYSLSHESSTFEFLEVSLPGTIQTVSAARS